MRYLLNSLVDQLRLQLPGHGRVRLRGLQLLQVPLPGPQVRHGTVHDEPGVPQAILLLSIYALMQKLGLLGSYYALMISYVAFTLPVGTWTLKTYFDQLPDSLIESAKIDGAGNFRIMWKIIFPMAVPGMVSIAIYGFVWSWNDLLYSMTLVTDTAKRTLASGLVMTFLGEASTNWGAMMAASVVSAVPVTIVFVFLQRYFIAGLTSGAVKG